MMCTKRFITPVKGPSGVYISILGIPENENRWADKNRYRGVNFLREEWGFSEKTCRLEAKKRKEVRNLFIFGEQILLNRGAENPRESKMRVKHNRGALFVLSGNSDCFGDVAQGAERSFIGQKPEKPFRGSIFMSWSNYDPKLSLTKHLINPQPSTNIYDAVPSLSNVKQRENPSGNLEVFSIYVVILKFSPQSCARTAGERK